MRKRNCRSYGNQSEADISVTGVLPAANLKKTVAEKLKNISDTGALPAGVLPVRGLAGLDKGTEESYHDYCRQMKKRR